MPIVKMPDGAQVRFPDDMPREQIRDLIASKFPDFARSAGAAPQAVSTQSLDLPVPGAGGGFDPRYQPADRGAPPQAAATEQPALMPNLTGMPGLGPMLGLAGYDGRPVDPNASMIPALDPINAAGAKFAESLPFVGSTLAKAGNNVDAGFASMVEGKPVAPEDRAAITRQEQEAFPVATTAGEVAGVTLPFMAAGATQLGAKALGMTGPLWQRMGLGLLSGGAITGGDAMTRGDDIIEALKKGAMGAFAGGAFPLAERGVTAIINALMRKGPAAANILSRGVARQRINPENILAELDKIGPDAVLADIGPNLARQAAAVASLPGEGQTILRDFLTTRNQGASRRIQNEVTDTLGTAPVPSQVQAEIRANQQALSPEYEQAFDNATLVDTSELADYLSSVADGYRGDTQRALQKVRGMLDSTAKPGNLDPNPVTLFRTRQEIDGMMEGMTNTTTVRALTLARNQVDDLLQRSVPGIKEVDAKFAEIAEQGKAFTQGQTTLSTGPQAAHPADIAEQMIARAIPEGQMTGPSAIPFRLSQGARAQIDQIIGTTANDLLGLKKAVGGDGDWNRAKLVSEFGQDRADQLLALLDREVRQYHTYNTVVGNSETAARNAAQKDVAPMEFGKNNAMLDLLMSIP